MEVFEIYINEQKVQLLEQLPETVFALSVVALPIRMPLSRDVVPHIKKWFNEIIDKIQQSPTNWVTYNNVYIQTNDLRRFDESETTGS